MASLHKDDALAISRHLEYLRLLGRSEITIYTRSRTLARVGAALRPARLVTATVPQLYDWRARLEVCDSSVLRYVTDVAEFYGWLVETGQRADNPAAVLPVPRDARRLPRPISTDELAYAVAAAPARIRPWLVLAAWCGLRAKEIALLRRENVLDTADPPVLIVALETTKGGRREHVVPLHPFPLAELRAMPMPRSGWMFPRRDGRAGPVQPNRVSHLTGDCLHGLGVGASLHQLRHWFGTETYRGCKDLRVVQELMGHASPHTTAGYAAISRAGTEAAVNALPDFRPPLANLPGGRAGYTR